MFIFLKKTFYLGFFLISLGISFLIKIDSDKKKLEIQLRTNYDIVNMLVKPEYASEPFWKFYNNELANMIAGDIFKLEHDQAIQKIIQSKKIPCLDCIKRMHVRLVLMEIPELREDSKQVEIMLKHLIPWEQAHPVSCPMPREERMRRERQNFRLLYRPETDVDNLLNISKVGETSQ